jgi:hypothetical protein
VGSQARKVRNERVFRDANERIRRTQQALELDGPLPFVCECWNETCHEVVHVKPSEYESVRASDACFLIAPEHPHDDADVVARHDAYWVIEKQ